MALRSTAHSRAALFGVAVAGALAGSAGTAAAQYYGYDDAPYLEQRFGYGYRYAPPRPPVAIPPRAASRIAARDLGLVRVDRTIATGSAYVVDGRTRAGARLRVIVDRYSGQVLDEILLQAPARSAPRVARTDPREDVRPRTPGRAQQPPERPATLKPPGQATAPATVVPPSPAAPRVVPAPVPEKPPAAATAPATVIPPAPAAPPRTEPAPAPEKPPAAASAPATEVPPSPAAPPRVEPAPTPEKPPADASAPATQPLPAPVVPTPPTPAPDEPPAAADKPRLVNPSDVRGTEPVEIKPPLARSEPGIPAQLPPVQPQDTTSATPPAETPQVPVVPLD
ncbi:hypothetical protein IP69_13495 [Bosea sp. AAP35]|uniref:hypothetical protein n=1 Tax=Bosea sp. AAP35 TaxID=1523417 RepID=UPI0006B91626|nr:hypothetical protein [Bosea sp. AAP35]KPF67358.1 hypothetical protein IP69_13495 [Bosea sp. AAP35]